MSEKNTTRGSEENLDEMESRTDWERLEEQSDEDIASAVREDPDSVLLDENWFRKARLVEPSVEKRRITIRIDEDVVEYFKKGGSGYQTRINDVLRAFVLSKKWDEQAEKDA